MSVTCGRVVIISGYSVSSTNKIDRHDITEILLKVAFNTITPTIFQTYRGEQIYYSSVCCLCENSILPNIEVTLIEFFYLLLRSSKILCTQDAIIYLHSIPLSPPFFPITSVYQIYSCIHLLYYVTCCHFLIHVYNIIV